MKNYFTLFGILGIVAAAAALVMFTGADVFAAHPHSILYTATFGAMVSNAEVKAAFGEIGEAFDAFKSTIENDMKSKLGKDDPIVTEKLAKIEKSLDTAVEAKAAIEKAIEAERKEREELEAKLNRMNFSGKTEDGKRLIELKEFNTTLAALNGSRGIAFTPLDEKGMDAYKSASVSFLRRGKENMTAEEVKTMQVGVDPDGGYFVTPDTSGQIVKKVYETSDIRQIASVQVISSDRLEGIEDNDEAGAGYAGEQATSGSTTTPQVGKWEIPVWWIDTEPKTTQQLLDDAAIDVEGWLGGKVADKFARFENKEFVKGVKIRGFTSYPVVSDDGTGVTWGSIGYVPSGTSGDISATAGADKIHDLVGTLKSAYLANARFVSARPLITKIRKFKDGQGNYLWQPSFVLGQPETILGYPVARAEDMPALAANSLSLAFGDFRAGYQIVDRQGVRVLRDNLTSKPFVKFYTTKRTGGGVINFEAIKLMKFATS